MKKTLMIATLLLGSMCARAQDIHFSQFYETNVLRNPAFMGQYPGDYKIGVVYRNQWSSISKPFQTGVLSAETKIPVKGESGDYFTAGLLAFYDRAGSIDMQTIGVYPAISFTKYLGDGSRTFISAGFTGGFLQRSFDPSKVIVGSQYGGPGRAPIIGNGENFANTTLTNWDIGAGIAVNSAAADEKLTYYAGISGYHFNRPGRSFDAGNTVVKLEMKLNVGAGLTYRLSDQYGVQMHANYSRQGVYNEFIGGGLLGWKRVTNNDADPPLSIYGGVFYRVKDAAIPTVKIDYKKISINASYDFTTSKLRPANTGNGGFELSIMHSGLFNSSKYERARTICPKPW